MATPDVYKRQPKACPLLEVADAGERTFAQFGKGSDIATDIPRYRVDVYKRQDLCQG